MVNFKSLFLPSISVFKHQKCLKYNLENPKHECVSHFWLVSVCICCNARKFYVVILFNCKSVFHNIAKKIKNNVKWESPHRFEFWFSRLKGECHFFAKLMVGACILKNPINVWYTVRWVVLYNQYSNSSRNIYPLDWIIKIFALT